MKTRALNATLRFGTARTFTMAATAAAARGGSRMQRWFPGTAHPLIVSAPMAYVSNPKLATEVTRAKGFGFIQGGRLFKPGSSTPAELEEQLTLAKKLLLQAQPGPHGDGKDAAAEAAEAASGVLPIGVGFVVMSDCAAKHFGTTTAPVLARHRPAAVWLFAPDPKYADTLPRVIGALRSADAGWTPRIIIQAGTVAAARQAAELGADIIVAQGGDAGGHQFVAAAGIVSLVPEICDMVRDEFPDRDIAVWAAGGIADGRGVVAALALGAEGVVLGTRYVVAPETDAEEYKRKALLAASDGAANTAKSQIHDHVQGNRTWPSVYDGRALLHQSYHDDKAGMAIEENEARYKAAKARGDFSNVVTWSSTAVGLVRTAPPAAEITRNLRDEALRVMGNLKATL
ncbi:FMN-dependent 2-nitropropane dioxygenase [Nemania sp. NC0429]|nr:FMN-dependent 2-nitropropane dioxygenase [Nemania sp. NC0429]